ncbi:MAG: hypothetical protein QOE31_3744 [Solirubrobacteraceae bacterium]|jgi:uncharacterized RDD family membrane protein YckC|nr:hypothetical protein [Solirubrobacteraceae bacterium]
MDGNPSDVLGRRIGAAFIDIAIVVVLVLLVGGIVGNDVASDAPASARFGTLDRVLILCLVFAYYWGTETVWAQTLGKKVLDIRVERVDGTKASAGATFVRTLLRLVDGLGLYIVGLIAIFATGERRARLGDLAAKTRVVAAGSRPDEPTAPPPPPSDEDVIASVLR